MQYPIRLTSVLTRTLTPSVPHKVVQTHLGVPYTVHTLGAPLMASRQTGYYMQTDCSKATEPGALVWQSERILSSSEGLYGTVTVTLSMRDNARQ